MYALLITQRACPAPCIADPTRLELSYTHEVMQYINAFGPSHQTFAFVRA